MSRTAEDWSHTLTQAYLALRQGRTAEAASVFAKVSIKAPAEIAKVARLEIKTRFLNDLVRNDESDAAFVFERVIDACFPQVNGHDKELFRQASRIVLSDLEQQGKVVLLGPLFMTKYAFQQKKLKLIGLLSQKERRTLEWSKALEFMVGSSRADLVGKHEWKKAARLLREGGVLSCSSDRVKLGCSMSPLDLVHEWMSLTRRPVRQGTPLTQAIGHKATLDRMMLEKASADPRFVLLREYLWLSTLMDEIESKWLDALRTGETGQHLTLWLGGEFKGHRENRAWGPPKEFCSYLESRLAQIAQDSGYRRIGAAIWADKERFFAHIGVWSKRLKKAEVSMRQIREDLGLKGSAVHGSVWWHIRRRMNEAGFTRMGDRFWHAARIQDAVRVLIGSGTPEPLGWNELMSALRERHKIEIRQQELKRLLEQDLSVVCAAEGVFLRERQATVCQVKHSAEIAVGDTGYASSPQICEQVKKDWGKVATPSTIDVALCTDKLYTHIHGGWALAPEFDWIWAIRAQMAPSEPGAWADGVIGWVPDESESSLVTDTWHEGRGALLQAATLLVTGQDVSNSRLRIYPCLRELFPNARFVASFGDQIR